MNRTLDPIQLQRLIDGESSSEEVRQLLLEARQNPACWEQLGITLLEDRAWQHLLDGECFVSADEIQARLGERIADSGRATSAETVFSGRESVSELASQSGFGLTTAADHVKTGSSTNQWKHWLAMAASVVAVALISYSAGQHRSNSGIVGHFGGIAPFDSRDGLALTDPEPRHSAPQTTLADLKPNYRMRLPYTDERRPSGEVPLYEVRSLDQWNRLERSIPTELQLTPEQLAELNLQGIGVRHDFDVISGRLEDGRAFVVPIRSIRFSPAQ